MRQQLATAQPCAPGRVRASNRVCSTLSAGSFVDTIWRKVEVGQIVRVDDEELFPADLLCLRSALPDDVCFIRTTNLDGETNLKVRR